MTVLVALVGTLASYWAVDAAVKKTSSKQLTEELEVMLERAPERGVIPDVAVLTASIDKRIAGSQDRLAQTVYLLANSSDEVILGNAERVPKISIASWEEVDGAEIGLAPGALLFHRVTVEPDFSLYLGMRLTVRNSLIRTLVPVLVPTVVTFGVFSALLLGFLNRRFRSQVDRVNLVFDRIKTGELSARVQDSHDSLDDEDLSLLGHNINSALSEVERLLHGLETYSQVAAHELNRAVSHLRTQIGNAPLAKIKSQIDHLIDLVTHILELAKIEGTSGFSMRAIDLKEIVRAIADLYSDAFEDAGVELRQDVISADTVILGSWPLIESAVANLVSNALRYSNPGTDVVVSLARSGDRLIIRVRDQGPGVASTDIPELTAQARDSESDGHGFGLSHVQAVAIRHGAQFSLQNDEPGVTATLEFGVYKPE